MQNTSFAHLIDNVPSPGEKTDLRVPDDWMQGRTAYGGLVAALSLKSMRAHVPLGRKIRSLLFSFVGPVSSDPFTIQTQPLRSGKSVTTIESKLIQNNKICSAALGSFGADRDSKIGIAPIDRREMPEPSKAIELPYIQGLTPEFTRHFNYRWAIGELPFSGKGGKELGGWINFREQADCLSEEWLIALADAWPTPVLSKLNAPAAASTLNWALEFVHLDRVTCSENEWWAYHCEVDSAERGYAHERSTIWDPEGRLAIFSHQTTTVFA
ncbi:MAG: thioesterase family protein [Desulfobacter sp.]|nr:thioesterase family protein [Desulfobacter sp.]WDP84932.1 MAG: thioesterase family protein [Desulfobacter sp.]